MAQHLYGRFRPFGNGSHYILQHVILQLLFYFSVGRSSASSLCVYFRTFYNTYPSLIHVGQQ